MLAKINSNNIFKLIKEVADVRCCPSEKRPSTTPAMGVCIECCMGLGASPLTQLEELVFPYSNFLLYKFLHIRLGANGGTKVWSTMRGYVDVEKILDALHIMNSFVTNQVLEAFT